LERRINDPDYKPSDKELERYGKLKNAIEEAKGTQKVKDVKLPTQTPSELRDRLEKVMASRGSSARDAKDVLEDIKNKIKELERGTGLFGRRGGAGKSAVIRSLEDAYDRAQQQYENKFG
jgi:ABC-type polysaccharide/polyol phosphate transport system ATPase subunit